MRSASFFIAEQAIEVHKSFCGVSFRPLTQFPLHFTNIHRSSPVTWLPLHQKSSKAKGLRQWGILLLLLPSVWTAFPSSDYYALSATSQGHWSFVQGLPFPTVHSPSHSLRGFPCSSYRTPAR
jgi:hypothetical protein